jgi:hypothetical protein
MRWPRLVPVAGCALALTACGGGGPSGADTTPATTTATTPAALVEAGLDPPSGCYVVVFLAEDVSKPQIASVQRRLLANRAVTVVSYVSKGLELRRFAIRNPQAAKGMHVNPFTDRFEVVPRTRSGILAIVGDFVKRGGPITNVRPAENCARIPG